MNKTISAVVKKASVPVIAGVMTLSLVGCAANREESGALTGAVVGGVVGSQIGGGSGKAIATGVGFLLGAIIGGDIGHTLDVMDERNAQNALEHNRTGQATTWDNPDAGKEVTVIPTRTFRSDSGGYCREYQTDVVVNGQSQQAYGTACRQPDGSWKIMR
ncbi:MAG TPA: glycine zipper 2TM domain-containing protein [Gammaproteobacteria bacterium]|nr:glycine zipper 2TM domain-containing protein [Gammaproteobacteria bacterium]